MAAFAECLVNSVEWQRNAVEELRRLNVFGDAPESELACVVAAATEHHYAAGEQIAHQTEDFRAFLILLDGKCRVMKTDAEGNFFFHKVVQAPSFMGEVSLLTGMTLQMTVTAETTIRGVRLEENEFWTMLSRCPQIRRSILDELHLRMVGLHQQHVQQEKLAMLGTMTAGLMHELNNPGAAARRAASQLRANLQHMHEIARKFSESGHTEEQRACLTALQERALSVRNDRCMGTLEQSDAEEEMGEWLQGHGIAQAWDFASVMVASGISIQDLECLSSVFRNQELAAPVEWVQATASSMQMVTLVEDSVARVVELAQSVKSYAHEGQGGQQDVDVNESIHATVVMMKHKLREKNIRMTKEFGPDMPKIHCMCSGLNQVWTNLLDNAIDAVPAEGGLITIRTTRTDDGVQVTIGDNGSGISEEARERIFDPFFTTKSPGKGTGLGLGIVRKLLESYDGRMTVQSEPGRTEFTVHLPLAPAASR